MKPTDEVTGNVVAWWMDTDDVITIVKNTDRSIVTGFMHKRTNETVADPRTDMGTAMELLHHTLNQQMGVGFWWTPTHWIFDMPKIGNVKIPISGTEFCNAVVNLAETVRQAQQKQSTTKESR